MRKLYKISDKIFFLQIDDLYDLCMTFLRPQEFYESPSAEFKGKDFCIFDCMEKYSKEFGRGCFTYPVDWVGFNIPSDQLKKCLFGNIELNRYDRFMLKVIYKIMQSIGEYESKDFYLIGSREFDDVFDHELAHALYSTNTEYKNSVDLLLKNLELKDFCSKKILKDYAQDVVDDEINAYMATGYRPLLNGESFLKKFYLNFKLKYISKPFVELYNTYKLDPKNFEEIDLGQTYI